MLSTRGDGHARVQEPGRVFEAIPDEQAAIDHFIAIRWAKGEYCAYCGHDKVYELKDNGLQMR